MLRRHARVVLVATLMTVLQVQAQQTNLTLEGILNVVWGDPHPDQASQGSTQYSLALPDGSVVPLQLDQRENAEYYFRKRVVVSGRFALNDQPGALTPGPIRLLVDTIRMSPSAQDESAVAGTRKLIYLLVKFSDDAAVPHPASFYTDLTNADLPPAGLPSPSTINGFFKKTSWNQFSWIADSGGAGGIGAPAGWLTLPQPKSFYAPCGWSGVCANLSVLATDAMAAGRAQGIDFTPYENINFVLSNDLDCCAWGGSYFASTENKVFGVTWEPPWGQETSTYAHELGHSLGLPHSGWVYFPYDSPWDLMSYRTSAASVLCGSYNSKNSAATSNIFCYEPGDGYIAPYKDYLGWIPLANQLTTVAGSSVTVTLEGNSLPLGSNAKMLKICLSGVPCSGASARYFTVEARVKGLGTTSQYDNGIPGEGIIIHDYLQNRPPITGGCFTNTSSGRAVPIDSTPGDYNSQNCNSGGRSYPNYALFNAQWNPGQVYANASGVTVRVLSRSGSTFIVTTGAARSPRQITSN